MENEYNILHHYLDPINEEELLPTYWLFKQHNQLIHNLKDKVILERNLQRKIYTIEDIFNYLNIHIATLPAIEIIYKKMEYIIQNTIPIGIIGDYDVDGICSTALLYTFLKRINHPSYFFIGDRQDGYGPTKKGFENLKNQGAKAFIILDSGSVAKEVLEDQEGIIIVIDHHIPDENHAPRNAIILNPQINNHSMATCCTGGLVFAFIYSLRSIANYDGSYEDLLSIAGITTVCDVMNLSPLNSMYIQYTVNLIKNNQWPSIFQFIIMNKFSKKIELFDEEDLGFFIGPHINSVGRLCSNKYIHQLVYGIAQDQPIIVSKKKITLISEDDGYKMANNDHQINTFIDLLYKNYFPIPSDDDKYSPVFIEYLGVLMLNLNIIRKQRQKILLDEIAEKKNILNKNKSLKIFPFYSELIESFLGIVGVVAAKICDTFYKPSFIGVILKDKIKGSIRSIDGVNVGLMMIEAKNQGIIKDGGGHSKAGGFTVDLDQWNNFVEFCNNYTINALQFNEKKRLIIIDYILSSYGVNKNLLDDMNNLRPFGEGNPKLQFLLVNCHITKCLIINKAHLMFTITFQPINHNKKQNITGWFFFFNKNKKFTYLMEEVNKNQGLNCDIVVHIGSDGTLYFIDYRINKTVYNSLI